MTTLICPCGSRLNVKGMSPGQGGRCPSCGGPVRVPGAPVTAPVVEDEWNWEGNYALDEAPTPEVAPPPARESEWTADETYAVPEPSPPARVPKPSPPAARPEPPAPEPWFPPALFFPARGMEGLIMTLALGVVFWVTGTLIPEYCLGLMGDADQLGAPMMGYLVILITAIPVLLLGFLALAYWLQYLARVLIQAAEGDRNPPRPPDRNADGLLTGLGPWLAWLVLGLGVGLLPLAAGSAAAVQDPTWRLALGLVGFPYALMALLLSFLHDEDLAARPWRVLAALARLGPSFLTLSLVTAGLLGTPTVAFAVLLNLREHHFWLALLAGLPCWCLLIWMTLVAMQTLGAYYFARKDRLRWRRPEAWWTAR